METKFYSLYSITTSIPAAKAVQQILEDVQTCLLHLQFLPYVNSVDGVYSNITMGALMVSLLCFISINRIEISENL
jgi:hypothetical protein